MKVMVKKWGNSASIRIPANLMRAANLTIDQEVDVREEDGRLIVAPIRQPAYDLESMIAEITDENLHAEVATGPAVGNEIW